MKTARILILILLVLHFAANLFGQNYVVGYLPTYNNYPNNIYNVDLDIVTHIDIAFSNPDWNGNIYVPNGTATVVNQCHANDVKVLLSICGAACDGNTYGNILGNAGNTDNFVANLVQLCIDNNLDGIDVDIEGNVLNGNDVNATEYESFILKLRDALHAQGKMITAALGGWFMNQVTNTAAQAFDFIGMMSYDAHGTWTGPGQHSSYDLAVNDFNNWRAKGVEASKLVVGVPFYGYGWGAATRSWTFNEIVNAFPGSENLDYVNSGGNEIYYNGIPTIKQKTNFGMNEAGGVMIWELTQDASGNNSLLQAIGEEIGTSGGGVSQSLATGKTVTVSSTEAGENIAANVNDRNLTTRWASGYTDDEWLSIDLESRFALDSIRITWETAMATAYEIQSSSDGINWATIHSVSGNTQLVNFIPFNGQELVQLRILGLQRATEFGYSIYEIEVYGQGLTTPYSGTSIQIPAVIPAENYDRGGEGIAYYDNSIGNQYGNYRTDDVDLEVCTDIDGGFNIGAFEAGEWVNYSINSRQSMDYDIDLRVATEQTGTAFHLELDGSDVTGQIVIPPTGGWQTWATLSIPNVYIPEGEHVLTLVSESPYFNVNYIRISAESASEMMVAQYPLDGTGTDLSAYENHAIVTQATSTTNRFGRFNAAYQFNGTNEYLEIPDQDHLSISETGELSISLWMRPDVLNFANTEGDSYIHWFGKGEGVGASGEQEYHLRIYNQNHPSRPNRTSCYVFNPEGGLGAGSYVQETISVGEWIHIVATYDFPNNDIKLYKNGVLKDTDFFTDYNIVPQNGSAPLRIGTRDFNSFFQGAIDDVFIFNKRLTASQIDSLYQLQDEIVTTNIEPKSEDQIQVYPNPSSSGVFQLGDEVQSYFVANMTGQVVLQNQQNYENQIDLSQEPNGVYLLNTVNQNGVTNQQHLLMKQ